MFSPSLDVAAIGKQKEVGGKPCVFFHVDSESDARQKWLVGLGQ